MDRMLRPRIAGRTVLVCLALVSSGCLLEPAQESAGPSSLAPRVPRSKAERLTEELLQLRALHGRAGRDRLAELEARMADVASARGDELAQLARTDPAEVLRLAIPATVRGRLPASVRPLVEGEVDVTGQIEHTCADHATSGGGPTPFLGAFQTACEARLNLGGGVVEQLQFVQGRPQATNGSHVRVRGVQVGDQIVAHDGSDPATLSVEVAAAGLSAIGEQRIMVVLYNFSDDASEPVTPQFLSDQLFVQTDAWFREVSGGQMWLEGDTFGWFTVPYTRAEWNGPIDRIGILDQLAAGAGADVASYPRRMYYNTSGPGTGGGGYAGWGTVGGNPSLVGITGNPRVGLLAHELGHNLTLWHANALECQPGIVIGPDCTHVEYGDYWDVMGNSWQAPHYNAFQKERIGWLGTAESAPVQTVAESGTYDLAVLEDLDAVGPKALKVLRATDPITGARDWYYVELRQAIGMDAFIANDPNGASLVRGVLLHTGNDANTNSSYQLDMTPTVYSTYIGDPDFGDSALVAGESYADALAGVTFTTVSASASGASVRIDFGADPCTRADPVVAIAPARQSGAAGAALVYDVSVTNMDSAACGASSFALEQTAPLGWIATLDADSLSVAPLATGRTSLRVTSAGDAAAGAFALGVAASDGARGGEASAYYDVALPPQCTRAAPVVALAPASQSGLAGATLAWTMTITNRDSAVCAAATFDLTAPAPAGWTTVLGRPDVSLAPGATTSTPLSVASAAGASPGAYPLSATATSRASGERATASATYEVQAPPPCVRANPGVTMTPSSLWIDVADRGVLDVVVQNRDSASCADATFSLAAVVPGGWTAALDESLTLTAGASATVALVVTPDPTASGFYTVSVGATHDDDANLAASASANVVVTSTLQVSVRTDRPSYRGGETVAIDVTVSVGGRAVAGASVSVRVRPPRGRVTAVVVTTDAAGRAHHDLRLANNPKTGTWTIEADATSGPSAGTATTTFTVQRR